MTNQTRIMPYAFSLRDIEVIKGAECFTTFRFGGRDKRDRREFPTLKAARADAGNDPKALVYAVMGSRDALIPHGSRIERNLDTK